MVVSSLERKEKEGELRERKKTKWRGTTLSESFERRGYDLYRDIASQYCNQRLTTCLRIRKILTVRLT